MFSCMGVYSYMCVCLYIYIYMKIRRRERTSLAGCPVRGCPLCNLLPALLQHWLEVLAVSYTYTHTQIRHHSPFQSLGPCTARATWNELDNQPMVTLCRSKHTHVSSQQRFWYVCLRVSVCVSVYASVCVCKCLWHFPDDVNNIKLFLTLYLVTFQYLPRG